MNFKKFFQIFLESNNSNIDLENFRNKFESAIQVIFDINKNDIDAIEVKNTTWGDDVHNTFRIKWNINYKNKMYMIFLQFMHFKVPRKALKHLNHIEYLEYLDELKKFPKEPLTNELLIKPNALIEYGLSVYKYEKNDNELDPDKIYIGPHDLSKKNFFRDRTTYFSTVKDITIMAKQIIDDYEDDDNNNDDEVSPVPSSPKSQLISV